MLLVLSSDFVYKSPFASKFSWKQEFVQQTDVQGLKKEAMQSGTLNPQMVRLCLD